MELGRSLQGRRTKVGSLALGAVVAATVAAAVSPAHATAEALTRYSLANGCYALRSSGATAIAGAERVRMQATTLGSYLLYRPDGSFLAAQPDGRVKADSAPGPSADWRVTEAGDTGFTLSPASAPSSVMTAGPEGTPTVADAGAAGPGSHVRFEATSGCATYPEAELGATGTPARGETSYGRVGGILEGHMHWMTYEMLGGQFHCGQPWHPYGISSALPDCSPVEGPQGLVAPVQNTLNYGNPAAPHDTSGYPKMTAWGPGNLTYEGTYWRWIQRAWLGGLRLMVMSVNENRVLCQLLPHKTDCNEMNTVRRGLADVKELQRYADAQAGGPGKGFFEIVTDPYQARRVINEGRMAVVLEMEISEPFDCLGWDHPSCDQSQVQRGLDELYRLGVRSSLLLNKFDNPFTGVRFDDGITGVLINAGNRQSAGSFFSAHTCTGALHDNTIETGVPQGSAFLDSLLGQLGVASGTFPAYPPAPHCNTRGLTALGRAAVRQMMALTEDLLPLQELRRERHASA